METLTIIVKRLLENYPETRGDDFVLIGEVLALYEPRHVSFDYIVKHHKDHHIPSLESIRRVRQKIQEQYPELRANTEARKKNEERMKEYAKLTKHEIDSIERT